MSTKFIEHPSVNGNHEQAFQTAVMQRDKLAALLFRLLKEGCVLLPDYEERLKNELRETGHLVEEKP